jgi:hypothetical protein
MNRPLPLFAHALTALAAALALLVASPAVAQDTTVNAEVRVILGSNGGQTDSSLSALVSRLNRQFPQFDTFRQHGMQRVTLTVGSARRIGLPGGQSATIELVSVSGGEQELRIVVPGGGTTMRTRGGLFFVGGARVQGGTLILAISS